MTIARVVIPGVVKNGVIVPAIESRLPEGTAVEISFHRQELPADLQEEFAAWERLGDEAWAMIDEWEKEDRP